MTHFNLAREESKPIPNGVVAPARDDARLQALPPIDIDEVIGLCEVVQEYGGRVDLYDLVREFGYLRLVLLAVEGARMLRLIKTRDGEVMLSPFGRTWIQGDPQERQRVLHDQIASLKPIRWVCALMRGSDAVGLSEDELLSQLSTQFPTEAAPSTFWTLVNWGTYAQIFHYEPNRKTLALRAHSQRRSQHSCHLPAFIP